MRSRGMNERLTRVYVSFSTRKELFDHQVGGFMRRRIGLLFLWMSRQALLRENAGGAPLPACYCIEKRREGKIGPHCGVAPL
jgi:hypothetical protein